MTGWKRTHCTRGHEYTPENTRLDPRGKRHCRACKLAYRLRNVERDQAAARARNSTPEARARTNARRRERYATDPQYRAGVDARKVARGNARYATDPEFRERAKARALAHYLNDAEHRAKPEYRERRKALARPLRERS